MRMCAMFCEGGLRVDLDKVLPLSASFNTDKPG